MIRSFIDYSLSCLIVLLVVKSISKSVIDGSVNSFTVQQLPVYLVKISDRLVLGDLCVIALGKCEVAIQRLRHPSASPTAAPGLAGPRAISREPVTTSIPSIELSFSIH